MTIIGERLWQIGRSPPHHLTVLAFGLLAIVTGIFVLALLTVTGTNAALSMIAGVLLGVGVFFLTLALFLGAYTYADASAVGVAWRIAQLIAAVLILLLAISALVAFL